MLAQAGAVLGVYNTKVRHNGQIGVFGYLGATVVMGGNNWVDLWCGDKESSVDLGSNFTGTVDPVCTGFDD